MAEIVLKGRKLVGGKTEGEALVSHEPVMFLNWVDRTTGIVTDKKHELYGANLKGKILVYPRGTGSTGTAFWIYGLAVANTAPKGMINILADNIAVVGAMISDIPMVDQLDKDPTQVIKTGDYIVLDADSGTVLVKTKSAAPK